MTQLMYYSTRNHDDRVTASQAILKGIADDGGLYVPERLPHIVLDWATLSQQSYQEVAQLILGAFLTDYTQEELAMCINKAYDEKFDTPAIAPVVSLDSQTHVLELFHGNTIAFKDMALSILPHLMTTAAKKHALQEEIVILTATSGDTGKAAMAGFSDVEGTRIIVFYPKDGVSDIQKQQMVTQVGDNTTVIGIDGNFDDAQTAVKQMFNDKALNDLLAQQGFQFSSANSINIGRLVPQIVYYVYAYAQLIQKGEIEPETYVNMVVPTGNFGNILAAYYAKYLGVPIRQLLCASNANNVLVDFFREGTYNRNRDFYVTTSPSMDILVSSNLERLLHEVARNNTEQVNEWMQLLSRTGYYELTHEARERLSDFYANFATEGQTAKAIHDVYEKYGYTLDPHTAVAYNVYQQYVLETQDTVTPTIIVSTASPYKFPRSVVEALEGTSSELSDFELVEKLHALTQLAIPQAVTEALESPVRHRQTVDVSAMKEAVLTTLSL